MSDEYTELERLAKEAEDSYGNKRFYQTYAERVFKDECYPEVILKLIQKARAEKFFAERHARMTLEILDLRRVQTQLVEALEKAEIGLMHCCPLPGYDMDTLPSIQAALAAAKETM